MGRARARPMVVGRALAYAFASRRCFDAPGGDAAEGEQAADACSDPDRERAPVEAGNQSLVTAGTGTPAAASWLLLLALLCPGQPLEPAGQVPVPLAEQLHRRRQQHAADDRGVEEDGDREADARSA